MPVYRQAPRDVRTLPRRNQFADRNAADPRVRMRAPDQHALLDSADDVVLGRITEIDSPGPFRCALRRVIDGRLERIAEYIGAADVECRSVALADNRAVLDR
jgi:hypothetical protein